MTTVECILFIVTLFLFSYFLLKKPSFSSLYPLGVLILFVLSGTLIEISNRTSNEIVVYNVPGSSAIGIKTGKILNLYTDTSMSEPVVKRHCATLGLKLKMTNLKNNQYCIKAGEKKIMICDSLDKNILQSFLPDIVILTGLRPIIEKNLSFGQFTGTIVVTSEVASGFRLPLRIDIARLDSVHSVRKSGAFVLRI
jgi:hypothetical protein